jgi:hypothetical protein
VKDHEKSGEFLATVNVGVSMSTVNFGSGPAGVMHRKKKSLRVWMD